MANLSLLFGLILGGFFFLVTFGAGIALLVYSLTGRKKAGASQQWPETTGAIITSEVRESANTDDDGETTFSYYPLIEYTYTAGGQVYTSRQVAFGGMRGSSNAGEAQYAAARYPAGASVRVFYNPHKPQEAVLEQAAGGGEKTSLVIGIILLVISAGIAVGLIIGLSINLS